MKKILYAGFILLMGFSYAQKTKSTSTKDYVNPVKLTKEERNRPYMDEVLKSHDEMTPEEAERRRKNIEAGNPFKKYGYYPKVATLSKGKYLEFHDRDSIVCIGSVKYNRKTKDIVELRKIDLSDPDAQPYLDTAGRWFSPDPLSEEFSDRSPYNFVFNNPMKFVDPDGMAPTDDYKLLQNGMVQLIKKTNDTSDTLYATDKKGNVDTSKSVTVDKAKASDGSIIGDLAKGGIPDDTRRADNGKLAFPSGINRARTTNASDAANVFTFAANNSNVEWGLAGYNTGNNMTYALWTGHSEDLTPSSILWQGISKLSFRIHSHPGDTTIPSPIFGGGLGDYGSVSSINNLFNDNKSYPYPRNFMYSKQGKHLWEYSYTTEGANHFYPGRPNVNRPLSVGTTINLNSLRK
ncbi:MAG: hypothetical protein E2590_07250 [Chryseobacterium sp.]|nr:hypothetical protein [Chryseobacterium sp.]